MSKGKRGLSNNKKRKERLEREREKIEEVGISFTEGIWNKVFVAVGVVCFILVFYLLTLYLTSKGDTNYNVTPEEAVFSYTEILAGRSFSISDGEYLVVYYNTEEDTSVDAAVHTYRNSNKLDLYSVDMNDPLNTKYKSEEANTNPTKASELKINGPTLIKFNGSTVEEYIEGAENITDYLNK